MRVTAEQQQNKRIEINELYSMRLIWRVSAAIVIDMGIH